MNSADLIKRMQERAAARAAAAAVAVSASAVNKPENAQDAPANQSSGWRRVVDAHAEKTAERATSERCAKCHFAKQVDGWCYWQDKGESEWEHHWIETSTCRTAPARPDGSERYLTLEQVLEIYRVTEVCRVAATTAGKSDIPLPLSKTRLGVQQYSESGSMDQLTLF
jgi:hypothetical protein